MRPLARRQIPLGESWPAANHLVKAHEPGIALNEIMDSNRSRRAFIAGGIGAAALATRPTLGAPQDLTALTLRQAAQMLRDKTVSPVELTRSCLQRIERYNRAVNAFITITREPALATAREREAETQQGKRRGALHGIPIALKDNIDTAGIRTTGASELFEHRVPAEDAEVARRLKEAGAILLGKLNMHEFAYGARRRSAISDPFTIPGRSTVFRGDPPGVLRRPSLPDYVSARSAPIRADRFASRALIAAS